MGNTFLSVSALIVVALMAMPTSAEQIDLGSVSKSNEFVKNDFTAAGEHQTLHVGESVYPAQVLNSSTEVTTAEYVQVKAELTNVNKGQLFTPISIWLFVMAMALVYVNRNVLFARHMKIVKKTA